MTTVTQKQPEDRWQTIRGIWKDWRNFYRISGGLVFVLFGVSIGAVLFANDAGYPTNLYTEVLRLFQDLNNTKGVLE